MLLALSAILFIVPVENPLLYIRSSNLSTHKAVMQHSAQLKWNWSPTPSTLKPTLQIQRIGPFHDVPLKPNFGWLKEKHSDKTVYKVNWHIAILTNPITKLWVGCVYNSRTHQPLQGNPRSDSEYLSFSLDKHEFEITCNPIYLPPTKHKKSSEK